MRALLLAAVLIAVLALPVAAGQPTPSAELAEREVYNSFMEDFEVRVTNPGPEPMTVVRVSVVITWPGWAPTLYPVFEGREVLAPGEARVFEGPAIRMPQTIPGEYPAFTAVVTETPAGQVEQRFPSSVRITDWEVDLGGLPEQVAVPLAFAGGMLLLTLALFRLERQRGWPPVRAVPRFHRGRRT